MEQKQQTVFEIIKSLSEILIYKYFDIPDYLWISLVVIQCCFNFFRLFYKKGNYD